MPWEYNSELYDGEWIGRMAMHFQILLEQIVDNPDTRLSDLSMLTEEERHQLLVEWNDTAVEFPQELFIHQLFEEQVNKNPDAEALWFEGQRMSYSELNAQANQLAHYLREIGCGSNTTIAILMDRSIEMMVAILGICKSGGAYVPIDPTYPEERIQYMLDDLDDPIVVTQSQYERRLSHEYQIIVLADEHHPWHNYDKRNPISMTSPEDLLYVMYTSGSTGRPKGVMNTHQGVLNRILWMKNEYNLSCYDRFIQKTPIALMFRYGKYTCRSSAVQA